MKIRKLQRRDRSRLEAILSVQSHFKPLEVQIALELIDIVLTSPGQQDYTVLCAEGGGGVEGYICYGKAPLTDAAYDLYWIVVHPSFWQQGAGSALIRKMEGDLEGRGARLVLIETSSLPPYETPRLFYRKHGYREIARVRDYYAPGDDKLIFGKSLAVLP